MILSDDEIFKLIPTWDDWRYSIGYVEATHFARDIEAKVLEKLSDKLRDGERYRWLRSAHYQERVDISLEKLEFMDAAIDAAINLSQSDLERVQ